VDSTIETIFLGCFAFGALFTLLSGALSAIGGVHHHGHGVYGHDLHGHTIHAHDIHGVHEGSGVLDGALEDVLAHVNLYSINGFLTWFGATGYILTHISGWPLGIASGAATLVGCVGGIIVAFYLARLRAGERVLHAEDYEIIGTLARVTVTITDGGVGEIVFEKAGTRRSEAARSWNSAELARGSEVMVTGYVRGIALVKLWSEVLAERFPEIQEMAGAVDV
jgi:hypothetical protein